MSLNSESIPLVSVIIAAYNAEKTLTHCLDSVLGQTYANLEVIAVDDASTDETGVVLDRYAAGDSRLRVIHLERNSGSPAARNAGQAICKGEFLTAVDADDTVESDAIELCVRELQDDPELDLVTFQMMMVYPEEEFLVKSYPINTAVPEVMTGEEACYWSINYDFAPNGVTRASLDKEIPAEIEYGQYGDETTGHLILLKARKVKLGRGRYYYYQWPSSRTHKFSIILFEVLECRLSLKRHLEELNAGRKIIDRMEQRRWREFIGICHLFYCHRNELSIEEQLNIRERMRKTYESFHWRGLPLSTILKPRFMLLPTFKMFYKQLYVVFKFGIFRL